MTIPSITPYSGTLPQRSDPANFPTNADDFVAWQEGTMTPEINATVAAMNLAVAEVDADTVAAAASALAASNDALAAAASAASVGLPWTAGTYAVGDMRYSPIDFATYRCRVAGASTTDPSADPVKWAPSVDIPGIGGVTITGNTTLTVTSDGAISVAPATPGLYVTLPVATTCREGSMLYSIYNAGDYDYGVKDSSGTQLGWVRPRTGAIIGLADNSTAAGVWAPYGLEKTGITASYVNSTATNTGSTIVRVALDSSRTCFLFGGTTCYAIVYDASTQTWGTATSVATGLTSGAFIGVLSATNQVLVSYGTSTPTYSSVTLTIATNTITVNTPVAWGSPTGDIGSFSQFLAAGSSFVVGYVRSGTTGCIRSITVSGTVPAITATEQTLAGASTSYPPVMFVSGSVVRTFASDSTPNRIWANPYTISGTTITAGTGTSVLMTAATFRAFLNGNGNIVCQYINTTHYATIFKLTGTTEAASSVSLGTAPGTFSLYTDYAAVSASKTAFFYATSTALWYANILIDTAGTASAGTELSGTVKGSTSQVSALTVSGNNARFALVTAQANGVQAQITLDCSGTSPTLSSAQQIPIYLATGSYTANTLIAASDVYGVRHPKQLVAGTRVQFIGTTATTNDLAFIGSSISLPKCMSVFGQTFTTQGVVGASSNESYIANMFDVTSIGFVIQRVEMAA